ncbi:MAG: hypothetical protein K6357_01290 [Elusimicrobiota bacterium]
MKIKTIKTLAFFGAKEYFYSKFSYLVFFFALLLVYVSILVGIMAVSEEKKVLMDFFLSITQISLLIFCILSISASVQNDMETKRIYLILSRPVKSSEYILGKIFGVCLASLLLLVFISLICGIVLILKGYFFDAKYLLSLLLVYLKVSLISAVCALFVSLTTSAFTSIAITIMIWFLGHFMSELKYALNKAGGVKILFKWLVYLFPDFSYSIDKISWSYVFYLIIYIFVISAISAFAFKNKEF